MRQSAIVVLMLLGTVVANYLTVAITQVAKTRYAIAGGDIELHLACLIAIGATLDWLFGTDTARRFVRLPTIQRVMDWLRWG